MRDSSIFPRTRKKGDCEDAPENAIFYTGATNALPVLEAGNLVFKGGTSFKKAKGIGFDGLASGNNFFKIVFDQLQTGGAGVKIRSCGTALKKTVKFRCCGALPHDEFERMAIDIRLISSCEFPAWETWISPKEVFHECAKMQSCCQKLTELAKQFNQDLTSPVVATVSNVGEDWFLFLESKVAGMDFTILSQEGLTDAEVTIPNFRRAFTAGSMSDWFGDDFTMTGDLTRCLTVIELFHYNKKPYRGAAGTSNPATDNSQYREVLERTSVVFDDAVTNSLNAKNALITILTGTSEYNKRQLNTTARDFPTYDYCVVRTDAGDSAALEDARTDYATGILVPVTRKNYVAGKSYYAIRSSSGTIPTPDGADTVVRGTCGTDDYPCTTPDGCPEVDSEGCLNC